MTQNKVYHTAVITHICQDMLTVEIAAQEACGGCAARNVCGSGEKKSFEVVDYFASTRTVGQEIQISISRKMGMLAAVLVYGVPTVLMCVVIGILTWMGVDQVTVGLSTLSSVVAFFVIIRLLWNKLFSGINVVIES